MAKTIVRNFNSIADFVTGSHVWIVWSISLWCKLKIWKSQPNAGAYFKTTKKFLFVGNSECAMYFSLKLEKERERENREREREQRERTERVRGEAQLSKTKPYFENLKVPVGKRRLLYFP